MLAVLEAPIEKIAWCHEKFLARAHRAAHNTTCIQCTASTKQTESTNNRRSIHTQRDACRKISALVKRMGVQVSY